MPGNAAPRDEAAPAHACRACRPRRHLGLLRGGRGPDQADSYLRGKFSMMWTLAERPSLGRSIDAVRPGYFKFPVASHVVFYRQNADGIDVIRILHKRMDLERQLD